MVSTFSLDPADLGLPRARLSDVAGGSPEVNVRITEDVLAGKNGARRAIVVLNAAATLVVGKLARNLREGVARAVEALDSGAAARKLQELAAFTQRVKNAR